jgi:hypothetical protein
MTSRALLGAALLIAGVGVAAAQGMQAGANQRSEAKAGAHKPAAQAQSHQQVQHKQSSGGAIHANRGASAGAKAQTATRSSARVERPRAAGTTRHAATRNVKTERAKVARTTSSNKTAVHARTDKTTAKPQRSAQQAKPAPDVKSRTAAQSNKRERSTTGQGSSETKARNETRGGRTTITAQQRTKLRTAMAARNVPHVRRVNFALRRGIVVPRHVHFVSVAAFPVLIDLYPDYRPYSFFVYQDEVVFVDSGRRIVAVEPFEGGAVASSGGGAVAMETDLAPEEIREVQTVLVDEGFGIEVTGVWDVRTRDALITFQRRHGFAATGFIDTRTVTALKLNGKISQNHIRGANRATTGRGNGRASTDTKAGMQRGESNKPNMQSRQERSTSGQGGNEQRKAAQDRNEPKAEPKAMNEPKSGQDAKPQAKRQGAQRSTTGQGGGDNKMKGSEPNRGNQNKY